MEPHTTTGQRWWCQDNCWTWLESNTGETQVQNLCYEQNNVRHACRMKMCPSTPSAMHYSTTSWQLGKIMC